MGMTMSQKIIAAHCGLDEVKPGQIVNAEYDRIMSNDLAFSLVINSLKAAGYADEMPRKDKTVVILDHYNPSKDIASAEQCKYCRDYARQQNLENFFDVGEMGIEHALMPEKGFVKAGDLVVATDSHTVTYGALGAFSTGIGTTDMAAALIAGKVWLKVPSAIKVNLVGKPSGFVGGKDVILHLIGMIGVDGATYQSLEFFGDGIRCLGIDDRFTICNMAIEAGAKNAVFPVDEITEEYIRTHGNETFRAYEADADAFYEREITIDLSTLKPTVAFPHLPENTHVVGTFDEIKIDQVVIGSCTNGHISDLKIAADILRGKRVARGVRAIVVPATQKIYLEAVEAGYIKDLIDAGCVVSTPTCGPCIGGYMGILAEGERAVSTTNRNFVGRMGHVRSEVYLASPQVAAASAVMGRIASPEEVIA